MFEVTEKILASIHAMPMTYGEVEDLPYLKTISNFGISFSIERLIKEDYIIEKITKKKYRYGQVVETKYHATKKGEKYLVEHGYLN
jgi:hypothetical protein